jgi:gluconolactonase
MKVEPTGSVSVFVSASMGANGQCFGPDARLFSVAAGSNQVVAYKPNGERAVVAEGFKGNDLVVRHDGLVYVTDPTGDARSGSRLWLIRPGGEKQVVDTGLRFANGVTLSPDQSLLYVADSRSHWVYSYQIQNDGTLAQKQKYYWLHEPDTAEDSGADGLRCDRDGRLYVATALGILVCDQAGRVNCILPTPNGRVANVAFGGSEFDTLYATCGDKVYKRKMKVKGAMSFLPPTKPSAPRL